MTPAPRRRGRLAAMLVGATAGGLLLGGLPALGPATAADGPLVGLRGDYFSADPANDWQFADEPSATAHDGAIDYGNLIPVFDERLGESEHVGVRWTGTITAPETGEYTFSAIGDNGMRLWVDDEQLLDYWLDVWDIERVAEPIELTAGEAVPFRFDMFQNEGGANMRLSWEGPDGEKSIVPLEAFAVPDDFDTYAVAGAVDASGATVTLTLPGEVTDAGDAAEHAEVVVDGTPVPVTGATASDDTLALDVSAPVLMDATVRVTYDGDGSLQAGGEAVPAFDAPVSNASEYQMRTRWSDDVDPQHPLPEYPRPQLERDTWKNLNGTWQFETLGENAETPVGRDLADEIVVPYPVESQLSGVQSDADSFVYRRWITVPRSWHVGDGQRLQLHFGAVDYDTEVLVNGETVATHRGGYDAFTADITDAVHTGSDNELVVRVSDTTGDQPRGKQSNTPSGIFYTSTSGIWQTVWMEPVPAASVDRVDIVPDLDRSAFVVTAESASAGNGATVTVIARDAKGRKVGSTTGRANAPLTVRIPDARLWSPDDPYLYDVDVRLTGKKATDRAASYFGMRSIEVTDVDGVPRILLNGEQTYLLSTLDQGFWPDGVYTAPTDQALAWDIKKTKQLGFNTIRKHIKVEPARWYYHADKLGMLVWQDMPSGDNSTPKARNEWQKQLKRIVRDVDFTSVIGWVPFNEGWGEWNRETTGRIADLVGDLDPTRIVNAHSGVNCCNSKGDSGRGDIIDWHMYPGPALPDPDGRRAVIDGEHGGFSLSVPGRVWPGGSVNPYQEVDTSDELTDAYVENTEQLIDAASEWMSGSVYTQITDLEGEVNGFFTYDREVEKMDRARVAEVNHALIEAGS